MRFDRDKVPDGDRMRREARVAGLQIEFAGNEMIARQFFERLIQFRGAVFVNKRESRLGLRTLYFNCGAPVADCGSTTIQICQLGR